MLRRIANTALVGVFLAGSFWFELERFKKATSSLDGPSSVYRRAAEDYPQTCAADDGTCKASATAASNKSPSKSSSSSSKKKKSKEDADTKTKEKRSLSCEDTIGTCANIVASFESKQEACIKLFRHMKEECRKTCGLCGANPSNNFAETIYSDVPQTIEGTGKKEVWQHFATMQRYMFQKVYMGEQFKTKHKLACRNHHKLCTYWASRGECESNAKFMQENCLPACFACDKLLTEDDAKTQQQDKCVDKSSECEAIVARSPSREEACIESFDTMRQDCRKTCQLCGNFKPNTVSNIYSQVPQKIQGSQAGLTRKNAEIVDDYMYNTVYVQERFAAVRGICKNRDELCLFWASIGECDRNAGFMKSSCAPSCLACESATALRQS